MIFLFDFPSKAPIFRKMSSHRCTLPLQTEEEIKSVFLLNTHVQNQARLGTKLSIIIHNTRALFHCFVCGTVVRGKGQQGDSTVRS